MHAEAVLLVDDGEREVVERHLVLEQRMGADEEIDIALGEAISSVGALPPALAAGEDGDAHAGSGGQRRDSVEMLAGEDFGRRHQGSLAAGLDHGRRRKQRYHRLAGADIAMQEPQHPLRRARSTTMSSTARCWDGVSE